MAGNIREPGRSDRSRRQLSAIANLSAAAVSRCPNGEHDDAAERLGLSCRLGSVDPCKTASRVSNGLLTPHPNRRFDSERYDPKLEQAVFSDRPKPLQERRYKPEPNVIALLDFLEVHIEAFATCEIGSGCGLIVPPTNKLVVHYVLEGEGTIVSEHGSLPISAGMAVVIPRGLAKQINGREPILTVSDADPGCVLAPGLVKFTVSSGNEKSLVLGCAVVEANLGHGTALFQSLSRPLIFQVQNQMVPPIFQAILRELSQPGIGTKALVDTLMKQVLLLLVRESLKDIETAAPHEPLAVDCPIMRAIDIIAARPDGEHTVEKLARIVGMSRSCFAQKFAERAGTSPMKYVQAARLTAASRMLRNSTLPVKSIADGVGFASRSHFSRAFVTMFGVDPTTFRHQATMVVDDPNDEML